MTSCRMERAKHLLTETALPLHEIGAMVGYADQSHFTTLLRRHVATTPKAYREACGEGRGTPPVRLVSDATMRRRHVTNGAGTMPSLRAINLQRNSPLLRVHTLHSRRSHACAHGDCPVVRDIVVGIQIGHPLAAGHLGPVVVVKTRCVLEPFFVHAKHEEVLVRFGLGKGAPWHRKQLFSKAQETAKRDHGIHNTS